MSDRDDFETSPRFRGMDFTRSITHPEYYESPYANGAWDGWKSALEWQSTQQPFEDMSASKEKAALAKLTR